MPGLPRWWSPRLSWSGLTTPLAHRTDEQEVSRKDSPGKAPADSPRSTNKSPSHHSLPLFPCSGPQETRGGRANEERDLRKPRSEPPGTGLGRNPSASLAFLVSQQRGRGHVELTEAHTSSVPEALFSQPKPSTQSDGTTGVEEKPGALGKGGKRVQTQGTSSQWGGKVSLGHSPHCASCPHQEQSKHNLRWESTREDVPC